MQQFYISQPSLTNAIRELEQEVGLARDPDSSVFGIVSFAWAGFGGAFGAVVLYFFVYTSSHHCL